MKSTLYMETTGIPAGKTAGEITDLLVRSGAKQIATDYNSGRIVGLRWVLSPYLQTSTGSTVYELFRGQGFKMIAAPEKRP